MSLLSSSLSHSLSHLSNYSSPTATTSTLLYPPARPLGSTSLYTQHIQQRLWFSAWPAHQNHMSTLETHWCPYSLMNSNSLSGVDPGSHIYWSTPVNFDAAGAENHSLEDACIFTGHEKEPWMQLKIGGRAIKWTQDILGIKKEEYGWGRNQLSRTTCSWPKLGL